MKEIACQFGDNKRLSGIMTLSNQEASTSNKAIVFLNAGLVTRHGPYRIHTRIARLAAQYGLNSLRFDYGDLGYSQPEQSGNSLITRTNNEIKEALDYLQSELRINQFILFGLCSGAEDGFRYADIDERVKGVIMIDSFSYKIPQNALISCLFRFQSWVFRKLRKLKNKPYYQKKLAHKEANLIDYQYMPRSECNQIMTHLIQRNVAIHFIYTSGIAYPFRYKEQFWTIFPELKPYKLATLDYLPTIGHVQLFEDERGHLLEVIEKRLIDILA